jgi:hydrogenase-4 component B
VHCLRAGGSTEIAIPWAVPLGTLRLGLDPLTAFFLIPLFGLAAPCAIYGAVYLLPPRGASPGASAGLSLPGRTAGLAGCFFNLTVAAMTGVLLARDGVVLLVAWEVMTVASYLLVVLDHQQLEVRRAGWVYLVAGHLGVAFLFALVLLLARTSGEFGFAALAAGGRGTGVAAVAFVLALIGFGVKAGVVPLHIWLPEAHAAAPSHVSALMSGALIKLGLYGLLRTSTFLTPRPFWGTTLLVLGLAGGLLGIALAIYQRDVKRALAYSSIENMGIILIGLGIGWWGLTHGHPRVGALGLAGGLLHVWNHAALKGLLFLCAGSILHGGGGKDLERMGGLLRRMPWTGTLMLTGAVGIAGLPPLNAFASEWLIYLGLFQGGLATRPGLMPLFAGAGLASMGVMAALCFVRLTGIALLGQPRSPAAAGAHEASRWMLAPMLALVTAAAAMSLAAPRLVALVAPAAAQVAGVPVESGAGRRRAPSGGVDERRPLRAGAGGGAGPPVPDPRRGPRRDLGLRLPGPRPAHAVHRASVRRADGRPAAPPGLPRPHHHAPAHGALRRARHAVCRSHRSGDPRRLPAVLRSLGAAAGAAALAAAGADAPLHPLHPAVRGGGPRLGLAAPLVAGGLRCWPRR